MKNKHIEIITKVLFETDLSFKDARIRDAFLKELGAKHSEKEENRKKILEALGEINREKNIYEFPDAEKGEQAVREINTLEEEEIKIELPEELKTFIEGTNYKPRVGEANIIDSICF